MFSFEKERRREREMDIWRASHSLPSAAKALYPMAVQFCSSDPFYARCQPVQHPLR